MTPQEYQEKKQARIEYLKKLAEKTRVESKKIFAEANSMASAIPFGQPILIGHHSEQSDRNFRKRIWTKYERAFNLDDKAEYYNKKAISAEKNQNIYSDDPEAIEKLRQKIKRLEENQEIMKKANKIIKKNLPATEKFSELVKIGIDNNTATELLNSDRFGGAGFAQFELSNNRANITRLKKRLEELEARQNKQNSEETINGIRIVENIEMNRLQIFFPNIPSEETRKNLKSNGFRWSPLNKCWQTHLSNYAKYKAETIITKLKEVNK